MTSVALESEYTRNALEIDLGKDMENYAINKLNVTSVAKKSTQCNHAIL